MTEKEQAFWDWWNGNQVEKFEHLYNLRMAFDAGYDAGKEAAR